LIEGLMAKTVADLLVERLIGWGVEIIFGIPGDGINGVFEALRTRQDKIKFIQVRHEEAAAFAACGYAKFTGRLGVCIATSGPGGIHLLNGLYDAKCDGAPVLAITGDTYHDLSGTLYQQDVDLVKVFLDVADFNQRITGAGHVNNVLDKAIKTSLMRRGVSHITIPKDVQEWTAGDEKRSRPNVSEHSADIFAAVHPMPHPKLIEAAAQLINRGSRVAILAGQGCLSAREEILQLAQKAGAPIIKALLGKAVVPDDSPYTTGGIGLLGTAPSQDALQSCDTLVIAGSSMPYVEFYPKPGKTKAIQIDIDPSRIGLRHPVELGLAGECGAVLRALLPLVERKSDRSFLEKAQKNTADWNTLMEARGTRTEMPMKPQVVVRELNKLLDDDAIVVTDSGTITGWTARYIQMRGNMKFAVSGSLASMANGLPYSVAAAMAYPGRQVVCIIGDGGMSMLLGELATIVKYNLAVKILVIKNNVLGQIKWEQIAMDGAPEFGIELQPIDFAGVALSFGAAGYTIEDPSQAPAILREALAHPGVSVVQAVVDPNEPQLPGHITSEQALNFMEAMLKGDRERSKIIKTVLKNKVRELV
jgi:pyruvate dehydrogenase (quinone)